MGSFLITPELIERFLAKVEKSDNCWIWIAAKRSQDSGYGVMKINGVLYSAHRLSYLLFVGNIPDKQIVCHSCDNPLCVNPEHLWAGTYQDNTKDAIKKGNHFLEGLSSPKSKTGENHSHAKLSDLQVLEIIESSLPIKELASLYGVSVSHVYHLKNRSKRQYLLPSSIG